MAALPDEQARGDAFEVFAEACLATLRQHDAAEVWPLTAVPLDVLRSLALGTSDFGVDGVVKTPLGHFNAYQVKFRTDRPRRLAGKNSPPNNKNIRVLVVPSPSAYFGRVLINQTTRNFF